MNLAIAPGTNYKEFLNDISTDPESEKHMYKDVVLNHYDKDPDYTRMARLCEQMRNCITARMEDDTSRIKLTVSKVLTAGRIFDTKDWPSNREYLVTYGIESLTFLREHFAEFLTHLNANDPDAISREWTQMKAILGAVTQDLQSMNCFCLMQSHCPTS